MPGALPPPGDGTGRFVTMRIVVDRDLCQGHAACEGEAPEVFSVSKKGELTVLDPNPPEEGRASVELAVKYCPTHALRIEED
jgi:ferredoxin